MEDVYAQRGDDPQAALTDAWRRHRVEEPGSVLPSKVLDIAFDESGDEFNHLREWDQSSSLLVVHGASFLDRQYVAFQALREPLSSQNWSGYWTANDYVQNYDLLADSFKLARVTNGSDDVLREAYRYERRVHAMEASEWLFLDMVSEAHLTSAKAFSLFNLAATRASSSRFHTVISVRSLNACVDNYDAARSFESLFSGSDSLVVSATSSVD